MGIKGDLKGDGFQLGATLLIDKGGEVLYEYRQTSYGDHPSMDDLKAAFEKYDKLHPETAGGAEMKAENFATDPSLATCSSAAACGAGPEDTQH